MASPSKVHGNLYAGTPVFPTYIDEMVLGADTQETYTVPAGMNWAIIVNVSSGTVWARSGAAASVPAAEVADGTGSFPLPPNTSYQCQVAPGGTLSFIRTAGTAATVSIALWTVRPSGS